MKEGMQIVNIQNPEWGTFIVLRREVETMWVIRGDRGTRCLSETEFQQVWQMVNVRTVRAEKFPAGGVCVACRKTWDRFGVCNCYAGSVDWDAVDRFLENYVEGSVRTAQEELETRNMRMSKSEVLNRELDPRGPRCDECNSLIVYASRGGTQEPFRTCVTRKCSEYMLTAPNIDPNALMTLDDGSGNQVLVCGRILR